MSPPAEIINLSTSWGLSYWGVVLSGMLEGVILLQAWQYYDSQKDGWLLKISVGAVTIMDTIGFFFSSASMNFYLVENWGNAAILDTNLEELNTEGILAFLVILWVQLYFAVQLYRFDRNMKIPAFLVAFFCIRGMGFAYSDRHKAVLLRQPSRIQRSKRPDPYFGWKFALCCCRCTLHSHILRQNEVATDRLLAN